MAEGCRDDCVNGEMRGVVWRSVVLQSKRNNNSIVPERQVPKGPGQNQAFAPLYLPLGQSGSAKQSTRRVRAPGKPTKMTQPTAAGMALHMIIDSESERHDGRLCCGSLTNTRRTAAVFSGDARCRY